MDDSDYQLIHVKVHYKPPTSLTQTKLSPAFSEQVAQSENSSDVRQQRKPLERLDPKGCVAIGHKAEILFKGEARKIQISKQESHFLVLLTRTSTNDLYTVHETDN